MSGPDEQPYPNLQWLFALQRFGIRTGLDTMRELLHRLGSPERELDTVLVGGTNGKGSVARVLAACLQASGAVTGLFTSPHLQRVGERARVNGAVTPDLEMDRLVAIVRPAATALEATFFEVITAASLLRFAAAGADVAVLEVGLGGRLDATNVVTPDLTVVTGVALDHTAILGDTVEKIAAEKAGIARPAVPLVTGATGVALRVLEERAEELAAPLYVLGREFEVSVQASGWDGLEMTLAWGAAPAPRSRREPAARDALRLTSPLVGAHQAANVAMAAYGALLLGVSPRAVSAAVAATDWPGRLERREHLGRYVVLDGAHNQQAAEALAAATGALEGRAAVLVLGMSADKDSGAVLATLARVAEHVVFTRAVRSPRSLAPEALLREWGAATHGAGSTISAESAPDPPAALARALELCPVGGTIVIAGSLFLVAEVRDLLDQETSEPYERWQ